MAQTILIKRSTSTAVPTTLLNGELAYSSLDNGKLFIGRPGAVGGDVDAIGGKYFTDIITGATSASTVSELVLRDASGDFAANMITSDLTGAVTGTVSDISNHSTSTLSEGTNKYYTDARARASISATGSLGYDSATGALTYTQGDTDTVSEGTTNLYYTNTRARNSISASGSLSYDNSTGVVSYTTPDTDTVSEGATNLYYLDARARSSISVTGSLGYDLATGVVSYTTPSTIESISNHNTADLSEGTNLYHTTARAQDAAAAMITGATHSNILVAYDEDTNTLAFTASSQYSDGDAQAAISVTDAGGDGSLSYASGTGVITYTGPSSTEVRAHFSGGTGVEITSGSIAIGQAVSTASNVTFNDLAVTGNATITGNLTVEGTTTTVNSTTVEIGDNILVLNKQLADDTAPSTNAGFTVYRGTGVGSKASASLLWDETNHYWTVQEGDLANTTSKLMTADNWANSFTGTIDGGTF